MIYLCSLTILIFIAYCTSVLQDVSAIELSINNPFGFVFPQNIPVKQNHGIVHRPLFV